MDTFSAINSRRSVKHYDPEHRMSDEEIHQLLSAAMQAPTAFNLQHWRFVVVSDPVLRQEIRANAWDQAQVTDASLLIVMVGDEQAWAKYPERVWAGAPQPVQDMLVPAIGGYYSDKPEVQRDEVMLLWSRRKHHHACGKSHGI